MAVDASLRPQVLILTNEQDVSVDWVVRGLRHRGVPYLRVNTERLPEWAFAVDPVARQWSLSRHDKSVVLDDVKSVWYRRPERPQSPALDCLPGGQRVLLMEQWEGLLDGLVSIDGARWVNSPHLNRRAESKLLQLSIARKVGLFVPRTVVTNDLTRIEEWLRNGRPRAVVKGLSAPLLEEGDDSAFVFTEWLTADLLDGADSLQPAPVIVQEAVWPKSDVRVTVVDDRVHAAIAEEGSAAVDWRVEHERVRFVAYDLPPEVADQCRALTKELELVFAAIDLLRDRHGHYVFLEVNPNGEWGWLQKTANIPIADALVDVLCR